MEIPLSPTHYEQPPTPDHEPPTPWEAESAIHSVLSFLRSEYNPRQRTAETETEPWMMLSLDTSEWPHGNAETREQATSTRPEVPTGRKLPDLPPEAEVFSNITAGSTATTSVDSSGSDVDSCNEVILRKKPVNEPSGCIYQTIGGDSDSDNEFSENVSASQSTNKKESNVESPQNSQSLMSPFDEQEEWSKISKILNSFGADIGQETDADGKEKEATTPNNSPVYDYPTLKRREKLAGETFTKLKLNATLNENT